MRALMLTLMAAMLTAKPAAAQRLEAARFAAHGNAAVGALRLERPAAVSTRQQTRAMVVGGLVGAAAGGWIASGWNTSECRRQRRCDPSVGRVAAGSAIGGIVGCALVAAVLWVGRRPAPDDELRQGYPAMTR